MLTEISNCVHWCMPKGIQTSTEESHHMYKKLGAEDVIKQCCHKKLPILFQETCMSQCIAFCTQKRTTVAKRMYVTVQNVMHTKKVTYTHSQNQQKLRHSRRGTEYPLLARTLFATFTKQYGRRSPASQHASTMISCHRKTMLYLFTTMPPRALLPL